MGLNPMILRQAQTFAFLFSPWRAPPAARHPYRASGLVHAQIADIRWLHGEQVQSILKRKFLLHSAIGTFRLQSGSGVREPGRAFDLLPLRLLRRGRKGDCKARIPPIRTVPCRELPVRLQIDGALNFVADWEEAVELRATQASNAPSVALSFWSSSASAPFRVSSGSVTARRQAVMAMEQLRKRGSGLVADSARNASNPLIT